MRVQMSPAQQAWLSRSTSELGLCTRTVNSLEALKVYTVEDLLLCRPSELLAQDNFGDKTLQEVYSALARIGFYVRGQVPEEQPAPPPVKEKPLFAPVSMKFRKLRTKHHHRDPLDADQPT